jgi:hypothetical protein
VTYEEELIQAGLDPKRVSPLPPDDPIFRGPHFVFRSDRERSTPDTSCERTASSEPDESS